MKLNQLGRNANEIVTDSARILFSYETPVAAYVPGRGYLRTSRFYSTTTSRHINEYISGSPAETVDPSEIEKLVK